MEPFEGGTHGTEYKNIVPERGELAETMQCSPLSGTAFSGVFPWVASLRSSPTVMAGMSLRSEHIEPLRGSPTDRITPFAGNAIINLKPSLPGK